MRFFSVHHTRYLLNEVRRFCLNMAFYSRKRTIQSGFHLNLFCMFCNWRTSLGIKGFALLNRCTFPCPNPGVVMDLHSIDCFTAQKLTHAYTEWMQHSHACETPQHDLPSTSLTIFHVGTAYWIYVHCIQTFTFQHRCQLENTPWAGNSLGIDYWTTTRPWGSIRTTLVLNLSEIVT